MSKFKGGTNKTIDKWLARGDGQGQGMDYQPFFRVQDVPSKGRAHKVKGLKIPRTHHYLSDLEYLHHVLSEYNQSVAQIREQFALLPREETQQIANLLGIKHSVYRKFNTPIVMTSDIVLTLNNKVQETQVISVKYSTDLESETKSPQRTLDKLLIEKTYWNRRGIKWSLSTEKDISINKALNLDMLRTSMVAYEMDWLQERMSRFAEHFKMHWTYYRTLNTILKKVGQDIDLNLTHCFFLFGKAVWQRVLPVDLDSELIGHNFPIKLHKNNTKDERYDQYS